MEEIKPEQTSEGVQTPVIHDAGPHSLWGRMVNLPGYKHGDWVRYGGMIYKPDPATGRLCYTVGDYASGAPVDQDNSRWPGEVGVRKHYANIDRNGNFFCS